MSIVNRAAPMDLPSADLRSRILFLVWGPPSHGPRSRFLAKELDIKDIEFVYSTTKRGLFVAPYKYIYQALATLRLLFQRRPEIVLVQSPPSFAALPVYIYCAMTGSHYLVDAHSEALQLARWTRPRWLYRLLARKAITTIVTNEHLGQLIEEWGGQAFILRDVPTSFPTTGSYEPLKGEFNVVFVSTFSPDEPIDAVIEAAAETPEVDFYVTGRKSGADPSLLANSPPNVHFTDFLPNDSYYALLRSADAVMCLTTVDHTMQNGACEALSLGKPIITSDWPLLQDYFEEGAVHVPNTAEGICLGLQEMRKNLPVYEKDIVDLRQKRQLEWEQKSEELDSLIRESMDPSWGA